MNFKLRTKGILLTDDLHRFVERRLRRALGRFGERVREVRVQLTDVNGPRGGGDDIRCAIVARLEPYGNLVVAQTRATPFAAVAHTTTRAAQALTRRLSRQRTTSSGRR